MRTVRFHRFDLDQYVASVEMTFLSNVASHHQLHEIRNIKCEESLTVDFSSLYMRLQFRRHFASIAVFNREAE